MKQKPATTLIDSLNDVLDRERGALIKGDLDGIGRVMPEKENLIDRLNAVQGMDPDRLAEIRDKLARNQMLLNSAMAGIRAVADRIAELRAMRAGSDTYDRTGQKARLQTVLPGKMEKRA